MSKIIRASDKLKPYEEATLEEIFHELHPNVGYAQLSESIKELMRVAYLTGKRSDENYDKLKCNIHHLPLLYCDACPNHENDLESMMDECDNFGSKHGHTTVAWQAFCREYEAYRDCDGSTIDALAKPAAKPSRICWKN